MFDSHRWVLRRLSSSKGYDVQPWLLIHRKQQHWDARGMNLSLPRMPIIVEPTTMLVVHTCVAWVCNYSGLSLGFLPAPLQSMSPSVQHRCYIAFKELLRLWGDCDTEKDVLSGTYLHDQVPHSGCYVGLRHATLPWTCPSLSWVSLNVLKQEGPSSCSYT